MTDCLRPATGHRPRPTSLRIARRGVLTVNDSCSEVWIFRSAARPASARDLLFFPLVLVTWLLGWDGIGCHGTGRVQTVPPPQGGGAALANTSGELPFLHKQGARPFTFSARSFARVSER